MNVKITLPEDISEITLEQYQRFEVLSKRTDLDDLGYSKRIINIFTGLKYKDVENIPYKDHEDIINQITKALQENAPFQNRFKIKDVEFGFIPNLDQVSSRELAALNTNEYVDGVAYVCDVENYHKIMAILFRPIISKDRSKNYQIASYNGTGDYANVMKQMSMGVVLGALGFFHHLSNELQSYIQRSTAAQQMKEAKQQAISLSTDGL